MHVEGKNLGGGKNYICPLRGFALCQSVEEGQHYVLSRQRKGDTSYRCRLFTSHLIPKNFFCSSQSAGKLLFTIRNVIWFGKAPMMTRWMISGESNANWSVWETLVLFRLNRGVLLNLISSILHHGQDHIYQWTAIAACGQRIFGILESLPPPRWAQRKYSFAISSGCRRQNSRFFIPRRSAPRLSPGKASSVNPQHSPL